MTFLLQVTPAEDHPWSGLTIAVFQCTDCPDDTANEFLAPGTGLIDFETAESQGIEIDDAYLAGSQHHRRFLVARRADVVLRTDIEARVRYQALDMQPVDEPYLGMKVGGVPSWSRLLNGIFEKVTYRGSRVAFLFQVPARRQFPRLPTAPLRRDFYLPMSWPPLDPAELEQGFYQLPRNAFVFGTTSGNSAAYLISAVEMESTVGELPAGADDAGFAR